MQYRFICSKFVCKNSLLTEEHCISHDFVALLLSFVCLFLKSVNADIKWLFFFNKKPSYYHFICMIIFIALL